MSASNPTEIQQRFLDTLFTDGKGSVGATANLLGMDNRYAHNMARQLRDKIIEMASDILAIEAPKAALKMAEMLEDGAVQPGANVRLTAAQSILDRVGIVKKEKLEVDTSKGTIVFYLPAKDPVKNEVQENS